MKRLSALWAMTLCGCGDLFDGFRIGTGNSVSSGTDPLPWVATYRDTASVRFPGDPDSIALVDTMGAEEPLVDSAAGRGWCLSLWSLDSSGAHWDRNPGASPIVLQTARLVEIRLVDSVGMQRVEMALPGLGAGSGGVRPDSVTTVHSTRVVSVMWSLALRWPDGRRAYLDSVDLGGAMEIDLSTLSRSVDGCRATLENKGGIRTDSQGHVVCK